MFLKEVFKSFHSMAIFLNVEDIFFRKLQSASFAAHVYIILQPAQLD